MSTTIVLTAAEARVLGVLVEKEKTVPDTYPLSLNALASGCNQKNNRDPLMTLADAQVQEALDVLKQRSLVIESSGARVTRYSHNVERVLRVPSQSVAILATLMLRGPQTAGELRINSERLHRFADISSVEAFLEELATRPESAGGPLVVQLARQPGEREQRWAHLLSGEPVIAQRALVAEPAADAGEIAELRARIEQLEAQVARLQALVERSADAAPAA